MPIQDEIARTHLKRVRKAFCADQKNLHVMRVSYTIKAEELAIPSIDERMHTLGNGLLKPKPVIVIDVSPCDGLR